MAYQSFDSYGWLEKQMKYDYNSFATNAPKKIAKQTFKIISPIRFQARNPDGSVWDVEITSAFGGSLPGDFEVWQEAKYGSGLDELFGAVHAQTNALLRVGAVIYKLTCVQPAPE